MTFTNKFAYNQSNRIESQLTPNRSPMHEPFLSWQHARRHKPLYTVNCQSGPPPNFVLIGPIHRLFSYQYWFWRGFIAFLVTSDYHFAQASCGTFGPGHFLSPICARALSVSPQAHIQTPSFACSMAGIKSRLTEAVTTCPWLLNEKASFHCEPIAWTSFTWC